MPGPSRRGVPIAGTRSAADPQKARRAGSWVAWLIAPHVVLGTFLLVVPDHVVFLVQQIVVLAHVLIAAATLPIAVAWTLRHVRGVRTDTPRASSRASRVTQWTLGAVTLLAWATGVVLLRGGEGMPAAQAHAIFGMMVAAPLCAHYFLAGRRLAAGATLGALALALASTFALRSFRAGLPEIPLTPPFALQTRGDSLYDPAAWCGECHEQNYDEWRRSTHGRAVVLPRVKREFGEPDKAALLEIDADSFGRVERGELTPEQAGLTFDICVHCHAPSSFYGRHQGNVVGAPPPHGDGITCSFCHTLRGVRNPEGDNGKLVAAMDHGPHAAGAALMEVAPFYVSAPETVRRYLGQGAKSPALRAIGDLLIRWRPQMHRRDYHSPFLDTSTACAGCHGFGLAGEPAPHQTYALWRDSGYNRAAREERVECQDCHMTAELTAAPRREPGRLVLWGPTRPQRRSHLFLGGNTNASEALGDAATAAAERAYNQRAVSVAVRDARVVREGGHDAVRLTVSVKNLRVGHPFPAMETVQRYAWVELAVLAADGSEIQRTRSPTHEREIETTDSVMLYRADKQHGLGARWDTTIPALGHRDFDRVVTLPDGHAAPAQVRARVFHNFDAQPFAAHEAAVGR